MKLRHSSILAIGGAAILVSAAPLAASAHVIVDPSVTGSGSYSVLTFSVGHGCEGSPTTALTFALPDSIESATPTVNPAWTITNGDRTITYDAVTPLPDGVRDTFELSVKLPEGEAGEVLAFPVLQECEVGQTDWTETAAEGEEEPQHPAPTLSLSESTGDAHGGTAAGDSGAATADGHAEVTPADPVARGLAIGGLVLGAVGLVLGGAALRRKAS